MPDGAAGATDAFFSFGTDFPEVAQQIIATATELGPRLNTALGQTGNANLGANLLGGLLGSVDRTAAGIVDRVAQLKNEIRQAIASGQAIPAGGLFAGTENIGREMATQLTDAFSQAFRSLPGIAGPAVGGVLAEMQARINTSMGELLRGTTGASAAELRGGLGGGSTLAAALGEGSIGRTGQVFDINSTNKLRTAATNLYESWEQDAAAARALTAQLREAAAGAKVLSPAQFTALRQGGNQFVQTVNAGGGTRAVVTDPDTGQRFPVGAGGQTLGTSASQQTLTAADQQAADAATQLTDAMSGLLDSIGMQTRAMAEETAAVGEMAAAQMSATKAFLEARAAGAKGGGGGSGGWYGFGHGGGPPPKSISDSFFGALFGIGWNSKQGFDPKNALQNLAGTAGVLARYGGEGRLLFGAVGGLKSSAEDVVQYQQAQISLQQALSGTQAKQVSTTEAIKLGAQAGMTSADVINTGAQALEQYSGYIHNSADATNVLTESLKAATEAAVLTGQSVQEAGQQIRTATIGFGTGPQGQSAINDAVANAARNFGGNQSDILKQVSQYAIDFQDAGFDPTQSANLIGLVGRDTGNYGSAGSELQKLITRGQNPQFIQALSQLGVANTGNIATEIPELSAKFQQLNPHQQQGVIDQLGGARAIGALLPLLRDGTQLLDANAKSYQNGGLAAREYGQRLNSLGGQLKQIAGLFHEVVLDVGRSGIFVPLGLGLELLKPGLELLNDILRTFDALPGHIGQGVVAATELYGIFRLLRNQTIGEAFGRIPVIGGIFGRGGGRTIGEAASGIPIIGGVFGRGAGAATSAAQAGAEETGAAATKAKADAALAEVRALAEQAAGEEAVTVTLQQQIVAMEQAQAAMSEIIAARTAEVEATDAEVASQEALQAQLDATTAAVTVQIAELQALAVAEAEAAAGAGALATGEEAAGAAGRFGRLGALAGKALPYAALAYFGDKAIRAVQGKQDDIVSSVNRSTSVSGTTVDALNHRASDLSADAQQTRHSTGGIFGSTLGFIDKHLLGPASLGFIHGFDSNAAAVQQKQAAEFSAALGKQLQTAQATDQNQGGAGGLSEQIDFSGSAQTLTNSLQTLSAQGYSASTVLDALTSGLDAMATAAQKGAGYIAPGTFNKVGAQVGVRTAEGLHNDFQNGLIFDGKQWVNVGGLAKKITGGVQLDQLSSAIGTAGSQYLQQNLASGGTLGPADVQAMIAQERSAAIANLKKQGKSTSQIAAILPTLNQELLTGTRAAIATANGDASGLTSQQIAALNQQAGQLASQAGQAAGARASLAGGAGGVTGAQETLAYLQKLYNSEALNPKTNPKSLQQLQETIDTATLGLQSATTAHVQAMSGLAASLVSPWDQQGQLQAQLSGLETVLASQTDADQRAQTQSQINQLNHQMQQAALAAANAQIGTENITYNAAGNAVSNPVADARAALDQATNTYSTLTAGGATGTDLYNAQEDLYQKRAAYYSALVQDANDARDAQIDSRDLIGTAYAQYVDLVNTANTQSGGQQAKTLRQAQTQYLATQHAVDQRALSQYSASFRAGDDVGTAEASLYSAQLDLAESLKGTQGYYQALRALKDAKYQLAQAEVAQANAARDASLDPRDTIAAADAAVRDARHQLAADTPGTTKYFQDLKAFNDAVQARRQAHEQLHTDRLAAGSDPTDQVAQARNAIRSASYDLERDKRGTDQYYKDLAALHQAQHDYASAMAQKASTDALLAGDLTDPIQQARAAVDAARKKLELDRAAGADQNTIAADDLALKQAQWARQKAIFDENLQLEQEQYQNHEISAAAYMQYLEREKETLTKQLAGTKKGTAGYYQLQQELEQVTSSILDLANSSGGQFNLGTIKLPTVYDVRRALAGGMTDILQAGTASLSTTFGIGADSPAAQAMQSMVTDPLNSAISAIKTDGAVSGLTSLQKVLEKVGAASKAAGAGGAAAQVTNHNNVTINADIDYNKIVKYLSQVLGVTATSSRAGTATRKGH